MEDNYEKGYSLSIILAILLVACSSSPTKKLKVSGKMKMVILSQLKMSH